MNYERRYTTVQYDAGTETQAPRFYGLAIKYNSRTAIGDPSTFGFYEEIAPGAVDLTKRDISMLVSHDQNKVVSRQSAGTLVLADTAEGIRVESNLDDGLSYVRDLKANLANKNYQGMSFGFRVPKDGEEVRTLDDGSELRVVKKMELYEVSAVAYPAYTTTEAAMRDVPMLAERRTAWEAERSSVNSKPEADIQKEHSQRERNARYLAARYGLPYERTEK